MKKINNRERVVIMKTVRLYSIIFLALTLAALLYKPAAALPIVDPVRPKCPVMNSSDVRQVERIDIPAYRSDYAILDRIENCGLDSEPIMLIKGFSQTF